LEKVKALLKDNPKLLSSRDSTGETPLDWAANQCHKDVVEFLLAHHADVGSKNNDGATPLDGAAGNGCKDVVELLLAKGADVNAKENNGRTPLHWAAFSGKKDVAELLLAHKADVNAKDNDGKTPLHEATSEGYKDVAELLLARGADVNAQDKDGMPPLLWAVEKGDREMAGFLLAHKADIDAKEGLIGMTSLHLAATTGKKDMAELLLANSADVNAKDKLGQTPLDAARIAKHQDIAELLLAHGAEAGSAETAANVPRPSGDQDLLRQLTGRAAKTSREPGPYDHRRSALATSTAPAADKATVYVFREHGIVGFGLKPPIYCDNMELAHLQNGRYFRVQLEPGHHFFRSKPGAPGTALDAEAGGVYYIRAVMVQGGSLYLTLLPSDESPSAIHKMKALDANQVKDPTRVAAQGEIPDNPTVEQ
jgi:ankyrin repeat protein